MDRAEAEKKLIAMAEGIAAWYERYAGSRYYLDICISEDRISINNAYWAEDNGHPINAYQFEKDGQVYHANVTTGDEGMDKKVNDIENGMAVGAQEEFDRLSESHWEDDRSLYLMDKFADDRDLIAAAVTKWLGVEDDGADYDKCLTVYDALGSQEREEILTEYIEWKHLTGDFDAWYEERLRED